MALVVAGEADGSGRESAAANEREAEEAGLATNEVRRRSAGGEAGSGRWIGWIRWRGSWLGMDPEEDGGGGVGRMGQAS